MNNNNNNEHDGQYFINRNIFKSGAVTDDSEFSRTGKSLWIFVPLVLSFIIVFAIIALTKSFLMGLPTLIVCAIAYLFCLRKMVFDENRFKQLISDNELRKEVQIGDFNNILNISDDGQIFFQTSKKGLASSFFVTFDYASLLDNTGQANENFISNAAVPFFKQLHENHFDFRLYDLSINRSVSAGTLQLIRRAKKYLTPQSWLQLIIMLQTETMANLEQNGSAHYQIFFEVINHDYRNVNNFEAILNDIIQQTLKTQEMIVNARIVKPDELVNFIVNYFNIDTFQAGDRNVRKVNVEKYFKFVSFFDINGQEYNVDAFNPEFEGVQRGDNLNLDREETILYSKNNSKRVNKKEENDKQEQEQRRKDLRNLRTMQQKHRMIRPNSPLDRQSINQQRQNKQSQYQQKKQEEYLKKTQQAAANRKNDKNNISLNDLLNKF